MSYLLDSIFTNYYIPPLLFAIRKVRSRNSRMVIDGKQGMTAIKRYNLIRKEKGNELIYFYFRFMNNEFAYVNPESDDERYYCKNNDDDGRIH